MNKKLIDNRKKNIGPNLSLHYSKPIHVIKSKGQYLYDKNNKKYLDAIGNIHVVGHCNKYVINAINKQSQILNTNTRYLYEIMDEYSKRILKYFPKKLSVIYFVCSGSEANDLALRIANNYSLGTEIFCIDNAYHGHTLSLIDISPYKFNSKGGNGKKSFVHVLDMPDVIRGKYSLKNNLSVNNYIDDAITLINKISSKKKISCFFSESILGCGGQVVLPKDYLKQLFKLIRSKGGICISDEVQTGFGRPGNNFWSFQNQDVIPDIVTLGKPMGNGHPIAALVTTRKIADSFNNGMEYFNSFGGTPVSLAAGNAVLDVIEKDKLQKNSFKIGKYLKTNLIELKKKYEKYIIDVRGEGLFLGLDFIKNGNPSLPNAKLANYIINDCKDKGLLLSTDGPYDNVIKIKPPLIFNKGNADFLLNCVNDSIQSYLTK